MTSSGAPSIGVPNRIGSGKAIPPPPRLAQASPGAPRPAKSDAQTRTTAPAAAHPDTVGGGSGRKQPNFPADSLRVTPLVDPVLDRLGHDPRSNYVERYWLPILGPSCLLLIRKLSAELEQQPEGFLLRTAEWAQEMGVGMKGGRNGPLWRAVERGCRFGAAQRNGELLAVRRRLPPLTARQVDRLPQQLRASHDHWVETRLAKPKRATISKWSDGRNQIGHQQFGPITAQQADESFDDAA